MTKEQIIQEAKLHNVRFIRLQFTDLLGVVKNVEIPISILDKALDGQIMFDGSSVEGFVRIQEADMYLRPDLDTWLILNWEQSPVGKVARFICDIYGIDGKPFEGCPRNNLKKTLQEMKKMGFAKFNVGVEPEFFLFKLIDGKPSLEFNDLGGYFDMSPIDGSEDCRRDIVLALESIGFHMATSHHEVAYGQHEVNFEFDNALEACDNVQTFKLVVKNIARRHNLHATFMPKPIKGINGSGMHTNCSLSKDDENVFFDKDTKNGLSLIANQFIAGVIKHAREFCLVTNPIVNSYKRLVPGYEAPCYISWSDANRSTMIRIPASRGKATRIEVRSVDPAANPYLAICAILASGLEGIKNELINEPAVKTNLFEVTYRERRDLGIKNLPENLKEALDEFKSSELMKNALGKHICDKLIDAKTKEWDEYRTAVTDFEIKKYLSIL